MKTYAEKLKDPRWQKKRLTVFSRDSFTCRVCQDSENTLHLHHIKYTKKDPWDEPDDNLRTVCEKCHSDIHNKETKRIIKAYLEEVVENDCSYTLLFILDAIRIKMKKAQLKTVQNLKAGGL